MPRVKVGSQLYIEDATREMFSWAEERLVLDNPEYAKKERMGLWLGNTPRELVLYTRGGQTLILPFGCFADFYAQFKDDAEFDNQIRPLGEFIPYRSDIALYPYQADAVAAMLSAKNGVLVMPCGSGKTQTALEIIAQIGGKALWLTHTQDLLNQSMRRAKSVYRLRQDKYGTITEGKVNVGEAITFATVQTMSRIDLTDWRDYWDVIIVDECHKAVGSPTKVMQFYKVLTALSARYKIGLTATPKRADKLERSMFALLGNVVHEVSRAAVADVTCPVDVEWVDTGWMPDDDAVIASDGTLNYAQLVDALTHDARRLQIVRAQIRTRLIEGAPTLVLGNRIEFLETLRDMLGDSAVCLSTLGSKAYRKEVLQKLDNGEIKCVLATYQLAKEGLDVPHLRYVIFATPEKDETTVTQAAGRVGRKADGKTRGTVIDIVDDFGMYRGWARKRRGYYKNLGYAY